MKKNGAFPVTPKPSLSNPTPFSTFLVHEESPFTIKSVPLFHEYKQARKALRAVLPISICTKLVGFSVDGVLILVFLWVLKAFLEVIRHFNLPFAFYFMQFSIPITFGYNNINGES
ncbi:hypothetical protein J1N35_044360 [Gossypium stocksii]|uniref:Uncharacterized protein n=1 Tax=Gossypium stocksii TaxID=47602 RepID=A0A9D3U8W7_9ROSI|nr:hypothetical protein J1N35_044360 [Gossypium stocksii]